MEQKELSQKTLECRRKNLSYDVVKMWSFATLQKIKLIFTWQI